MRIIYSKCRSLHWGETLALQLNLRRAAIKNFASLLPGSANFATLGKTSLAVTSALQGRAGHRTPSFGVETRKPHRAANVAAFGQLLEQLCNLALWQVLGFIMPDRALTGVRRFAGHEGRSSSPGTGR